MKETWKKLEQYGDYVLWTKQDKGTSIFCAYPIGETPTPTSGGYYSKQYALLIKGISFKK